jgi:hypothetical protein
MKPPHPTGRHSGTAPISGLPEIGTLMSKSAKADLERAPGPESITTAGAYGFPAFAKAGWVAPVEAKGRRRAGSRHSAS